MYDSMSMKCNWLCVLVCPQQRAADCPVLPISVTSISDSGTRARRGPSRLPQTHPEAEREDPEPISGGDLR